MPKRSRISIDITPEDKEEFCKLVPRFWRRMMLTHAIQSLLGHLRDEEKRKKLFDIVGSHIKE